MSKRFINSIFLRFIRLFFNKKSTKYSNIVQKYGQYLLYIIFTIIYNKQKILYIGKR